MCLLLKQRHAKLQTSFITQLKASVETSQKWEVPTLELEVAHRQHRLLSNTVLLDCILHFAQLVVSNLSIKLYQQSNSLLCSTLNHQHQYVSCASAEWDEVLAGGALVEWLP